MFISNAIKVVGCLLMLFGANPLLSYGIVGLGAAAYSPAKYGILTELLPNSQLVKANGWIEGLTILSIILGVVLGGQLLGHVVSQPPALVRHPGVRHRHRDRAGGGDRADRLALRHRRPRSTCASRAPTRRCSRSSHSAAALIRDFSNCNARLWNDKLGQISLATTTLFWGVSGNLQRDRLRLGRGGARLHHQGRVVAGRRGRDRHRRRRGDRLDAHAPRPGHAGDPARHRSWACS